jgi:dipeptide/tripeptide permease
MVSAIGMVYGVLLFFYLCLKYNQTRDTKNKNTKTLKKKKKERKKTM